MCTSLEVMETSELPPRGTDLEGLAWVRPSFVGGELGLDVSGVQVPNNAQQLACAGWSTSNSAVTGLVVDGGGRFRRAACNEIHRVACCAPTP